jgi:hypothetical protein
MPPAALLILTLLAATNPAPSATPPPAILEFPLAGYRINAFEDLSRATKANPMMAWGIDMSPHGLGSLPEVGVGVSPADGKKTLADVVKHEKDAFAHFNMTILSERSVSATEWQVDYLNSFPDGSKDHCYERVLLANGKFYEATATESESLWPKTGAKLMACVNSLEPITDPGATPSAASPAKLTFPQHGFRISPLDAASTSDEDMGSLTMTENIWVINEAYAKTLQDFQAEFKTRLQDAQYKLKIISESSPADNTWVIEYTKEFPLGKNIPSSFQIHTYQKVILAHGQFYQAMATLEDDPSDPGYDAKLKDCVDSLEIIPPAPPAP